MVLNLEPLDWWQAAGILQMNTLGFFNPVRRLRSISAKRLREMLQTQPSKVVVVDVRPPSAFANGHIPHAINQPFVQQNCLPLWPTKRTVVVYDEEGDCGFDRHGIGKTTVFLEGGWFAWIAEGYPIEPLAGSLLDPGQLVDGMDSRLLRRDDTRG